MVTANARTAERQVATGLNDAGSGEYDASLFFASTLDTQPKKGKSNGNWSPSPALNLQLRPISVPADWGPASYPDSRLPSSLKAWLASKEALIIGGGLTAEPMLVFEI